MLRVLLSQFHGLSGRQARGGRGQILAGLPALTPRCAFEALMADALLLLPLR